MKFLTLIGVLIGALTLTACGGSGGTSATHEAPSQKLAKSQSSKPPKKDSTAHQRSRFAMSKAAIAKLPKLEIGKRSGPPPRKLIVNDLRKGSGAAVKPKDAVLVRYFDVPYGEALKKSRSGRYGPTRFGLNEVIEGWELGLPGMKVGGRRELIVPPKLHYRSWSPKLGFRNWTQIYVIDLLAVYPGGAGTF